MEPINTRISYLYRDACNYKIQNVAVVKGLMSGEQQQQILNCLIDEKRAAHTPSIAAGLGGVSRQFGAFRKMWHFNRKPTTAFVSKLTGM